jgi:seryl-tRNA synthetase
MELLKEDIVSLQEKLKRIKKRITELRREEARLLRQIKQSGVKSA